jgi:hypothetical protein
MKPACPIENQCLIRRVIDAREHHYASHVWVDQSAVNKVEANSPSTRAIKDCGQSET